MIDKFLSLMTRYNLRGDKDCFWSESEDSVHSWPSSFGAYGAMGNHGGREHVIDKAAHIMETRKQEGEEKGAETRYTLSISYFVHC